MSGNFLSKNSETKINKLIFDLFSIFSMFFLIYNVRFFFLPINSTFCIIGSIFVFTGFSVFLGWQLPINKTALILALLPFVINLAYSVVSFVLSGSSDFVLIYNTLLTLHYVLGIYLFSAILAKKKFKLEKILFFIVIAIFIQSVFINLDYAVPQIRSLIDALLPVGGNFVGSKVIDFRPRGFSNAPGAYLSLIQSIGLLFASFFFTKTRRFVHSIGWALVMGIILLSIALSGRTGLLMIPVCIFFFSFSNFSNFKHLVNVLGKILILLFIFTLLLLLFIALFMALSGVDAEGFNITLNWIVRPFIFDGSVDERANIWLILKSFLIFPKEELTFIFGNLDLFNEVNLRAFDRSDLGYVRNLFGIGLLGGTFYYSGYFILIALSLRLAKKNDEKLLLGLLGLWIFLVEIKEPFLRGLGLNFFVFILFFSLILDKNNA